MSAETDLAAGFARLETLVETSRKQAAESAETRERAAVDRHNSLANEVRTLKASHTNLALEVGQLKTKAQQALEDAHRSSHDLSEHMKSDELTTAAIAAHIETIQKSSTAIQVSTSLIPAANLEIDKQTKILKHIRASTPIITAIASAAAAYFAAHH